MPDSSEVSWRERVDKKDPEWWRMDWHIDNFTDRDINEKRQIPGDFSALVGIYFTDNEIDNEGNFVVFPGGHHQIQSFSRESGGIDFYKKDGLTTAKKEIELNNPFQVKAKAGSVMIAHRMLPHTTADNFSKNTRYVIWFRVRSKNRDNKSNFEDPESYLDIWREWSLIKREAKFNNKLYGENKLLFESKVSEMERRGLGELMNVNDEYILLRCRPSYGEPCLFASMLTIRYYYIRDELEVHSNGFISRDTHPMMAKDMYEYSKIDDKSNFDIEA